jgi:4-cresol dehydrogenase (hydroxylating)
MMKQIASADDPYWQTVRQLKTVFDPDNIIAPGRYDLV